MTDVLRVNVITSCTGQKVTLTDGERTLAERLYRGQQHLRLKVEFVDEMIALDPVERDIAPQLRRRLRARGRRVRQEGNYQPDGARQSDDHVVVPGAGAKMTSMAHSLMFSEDCLHVPFFTERTGGEA